MSPISFRIYLDLIAFWSVGAFTVHFAFKKSGVRAGPGGEGNRNPCQDTCCMVCVMGYCTYGFNKIVDLIKFCMLVRSRKHFRKQQLQRKSALTEVLVKVCETTWSEFGRFNIFYFALREELHSRIQAHLVSVANKIIALLEYQGVLQNSDSLSLLSQIIQAALHSHSYFMCQTDVVDVIYVNM